MDIKLIDSNLYVKKILKRHEFLADLMFKVVIALFTPKRTTKSCYAGDCF